MANPRLPEFLTSPVHAELLAAFIDDAADQIQNHAEDNGGGLVAGAAVRMARADARAIRDAAGVGHPSSGDRFRYRRDAHIAPINGPLERVDLEATP